MAAAVVQVCSDPRLNHEVIRVQVQSKLERLGLQADRIFILNDGGGNISANTRNTLELLTRRQDIVVFGAVLHHDDCLADQAGMRRPLATSVQQLASLLSERDIQCPVSSGIIRTESSERSYEAFPFRMPRLSGR
jgi:hypothetical protein